MLENGVRWYDKATIEVPVYFPEGKRACKWCWLFCRYEKDYNRYSCKLTSEWLLNPEKEIGQACPLKFEEV